MKNNKKQLFITGIGIVVLVLAFLFGGTGITAIAANNALPGDTLYGVKTTLEQTRISLAQDASVRAELYMQFAETRLQEISRLVSEKRFKDISGATLDFETYTKKALAELEIVAKGDSQRAVALTALISEGLSRYARTLTSMLDSVPDPVRQDISQAIQSSQGQTTSPVIQAAETEFKGVVETIVEGAWVIAGKTVFIHTQTEIKDLIEVGDYVKVHVATNSDGDLVAREIELTAGIGANSNENSNNNNSNSNGNTNDDNSNSNTNDDNSNSNTNDDNSNSSSGNSNSNGNTNDDNSNSSSGNSNSNGNTNDDNSNSNTSNSNSNSNTSNNNSNSSSSNSNSNGNTNNSNSNSNTNDDNSNSNSGNDNSRGKSNGG